MSKRTLAGAAGKPANVRQVVAQGLVTRDPGERAHDAPQLPSVTAPSAFIAHRGYDIVNDCAEAPFIARHEHQAGGE